MNKVCRVLLAALAFAVTLAPATVGAQDKKQQQDTVTGSWNVTVKGSGAHGDMAATMVLRQEGTKVTGTFSAHGNDHGLEGTLTKGTLELAATDMPADTRLTLSAKLQSDGTLSGYLSGPVADSKWTATRARDSK